MNDLAFILEAALVLVNLSLCVWLLTFRVSRKQAFSSVDLLAVSVFLAYCLPIFLQWFGYRTFGGASEFFNQDEFPRFRILTVVYVSFFFISFVMGNYLGKKTKISPFRRIDPLRVKTEEVPYSKKALIAAVFTVITLTAGYGIYMMGKGGMIGHLIELYSRFEGASRANYFFYLAILLLALAVWWMHLRPTLFRKVCMAAVFVYWSICMFWTGKLVTVSIGLIFLGISSYLYSKSVKRIAVIVLMLIVLAGLFKTYWKVGDDTTATLATNFAFIMMNDLGKLHTLRYAIEYNALNDPQVLPFAGYSYVYPAIVGIRRSLWPSKPWPPSRYFTSHVLKLHSIRYYGWNYAFGMFDEAAMNFGIFGFLVIFVIGFLIGKIEIRVRHNKTVHAFLLTTLFVHVFYQLSVMLTQCLISLVILSLLLLKPKEESVKNVMGTNV